MREALDDWSGGIVIGGRKITNLRYADDTTLLAASEEEIVVMLERIERFSADAGLRINRGKIKMMVIDSLTEIHGIQVVDSFVYLGNLSSQTIADLMQKLEGA